jgi:serine/threonine protein kinase
VVVPQRADLADSSDANHGAIWTTNGNCFIMRSTGAYTYRAIMFHIGISTQHPPLPEPGQVSDLGIDFIERCLTLIPGDRPTAAELLHHPWLAPMVQQVVSCTISTSG